MRNGKHTALINQPTTRVHRKVQAATTGASLAGALVVLLVYFYEQRSGHQLPDEIVMALTVIVSALAAFVGGYLARARPDNW